MLTPGFLASLEMLSCGCISRSLTVPGCQGCLVASILFSCRAQPPFLRGPKSSNQPPTNFCPISWQSRWMVPAPTGCDVHSLIISLACTDHGEICAVLSVFNHWEAPPLFWLRINSYPCLRNWLLSATMMWCFQFGEQTLDSGKRGSQCPPTRALSLFKWLCGSIATSGQCYTRRMNEWLLFSQHRVLFKIKAAQAAGDTSTGLFQHPLNWDHWTQRAERKSDIYCQRLPHKELKRDRGVGWARLKDKGSLFADGEEWVDHNTFQRRPFAYTVGVPQMTWQTAQLTRLTCTCPTAGDFTQQPFENSSAPHATKIGRLIPIARHAC